MDRPSRSVAFPKAELRILRTAGLAIPVPRSGEFQLTPISTMKVHGVEHDVARAVTATRSGRELKATATTTVHFADFGMERPSVALVLRVQDDIRRTDRGAALSAGIEIHCLGDARDALKEQHATQQDQPGPSHA